MTFDLTHRRIRAEATRLAGGPHDVARRVLVYRQLYRRSGRNHVFPLIAAHGAIWGEAFIRRGRVMGHLLALGTGWHRAKRAAAVEALGQDFLKINRQVFIEVYTSYHLVAACSEDPELETYLPRPLITAIAASQAAGARG